MSLQLHSLSDADIDRVVYEHTKLNPNQADDTAILAGIRQAILSILSLAAPQGEPVAYRIDYPGVTDTVGLRRWCGADEYESARSTIEYLGGVFVPLYTAPAPQVVPMTDTERADIICAVAAICTGTSSRNLAATAIEWTERRYGITTPAGGEQPAAHQATKEPRK